MRLSCLWVLMHDRGIRHGKMWSIVSATFVLAEQRDTNKDKRHSEHDTRGVPTSSVIVIVGEERACRWVRLERKNDREYSQLRCSQSSIRSSQVQRQLSVIIVTSVVGVETTAETIDGDTALSRIFRK